MSAKNQARISPNNPLWYRYVGDDLAVFVATEDKKIPIPKSFFKRLWMIFRGEAYWEKTQVLNHAVPIALHCVVCALIYLAFGRNAIALWAALLFLIHPVNTEVSVWLSAKIYSTTAITVLLSWLFPFLAPLLFCFSPHWLVYFSGILAPMVFLLRPDWFSIVALCAAITVGSRVWGMFTEKGNPKMTGYKHNLYALWLSPDKIVIALKFYGFFIVNGVFGLHYSFYHSYLHDFIDSKEGTENGYRIDVYFFAGLASALYCIVSLAMFLARPFAAPSLFFFGMFWFTVNIAMWCNFVTTGQQYISNRQSYLANIGLCLALASVLIKYPLALGCLFGWYLRQLIPAVRQFQNVFWHILHQAIDHPTFYFSWLQWGNLEFARGHFKAAGDAYQQALSLAPDNFKALFGLSSASLACGDVKGAVYYIEKARSADVYGQEEMAAKIIKDRMELINKVVVSKGGLKLKISDIVTVS